MLDPTRRTGWTGPGLLVLALLVVLGFTEALLVHLWHPGRRIYALQIVYAVVTAAIILRLSTKPMSPPRWGVAALLVGCFVVSGLLAQGALQAFPNSGDEYGYNFVADTLAQGRFWNQAYPAPLRDVLETFYIGGHGDQRLSQCIPGWPAVLLPFKLIGIPQFANAVVGLLAGVFMLRALQNLPITPAVRLAALVLGLAAPFTLFNNASFFNHSLTAAALLGIIWLDLRDHRSPASLNRVGIGVGFSVLLATRYETFLLAFSLFAIEGLVRHRLRFVRWALPAAVGAAPITLMLLFYNWRITGSPFTTTLAWVSPGIGFGLNSSGIDNGEHSAGRGLLHTVGWFADWQDFAPVLLLPLYAVALWHRVTTRSLRWFDLLWPTIVVFFFFYPDEGGYQYGPRYWYLAFVAMPVTIAAGLPITGTFWQLGRLRVDPLRLATVQLASFIGFTIGFAYFAHLMVQRRGAPFELAATAPAPALVLVPSYVEELYVPWQKVPYMKLGKDYTRNGVGPLPPVALGIDLGDQRTALLCEQVPERGIYRLRLDESELRGTLVPVCNGAVAPTPKG